MNGVNIIPLKPIGTDKRGSTYEFTINSASDFLFLTRKKNTISGNAYQKGSNLAMNPKTFILLAGEIILHVKPVRSNKIESLPISQPCVIEISPYITHTIEAITNIQFLESGSLAEIVDDRVKDQII